MARAGGGFKAAGGEWPIRPLALFAPCAVLAASLGTDGRLPGVEEITNVAMPEIDGISRFLVRPDDSEVMRAPGADNPYQNDNAPGSGRHVPAPIVLPAFPDARRVRGKTPRQAGGLRQRWKNASGLIYEWDYQHGRVEVYDRRGRHLGEFDPRTGARTKPANPDYQVEP